MALICCETLDLDGAEFCRGYIQHWLKAEKEIPNHSWIEAKLAQKKSERSNGQQAFGFRETPRAALRAVYATPNDAARQLEITIIPNFRVPSQSVIHSVFYDDLPCAEAEENLAMWESSGGTRLPNCRVRVKAKRIGDSVHALIVPL